MIRLFESQSNTKLAILGLVSVLLILFSSILYQPILWIGFYSLIFVVFYSYYLIPNNKTAFKITIGITAAIFSTLIGLHLFSSPSWFITTHQLSTQSPEISITYNIDKLVIALCILLLWKGNQSKWLSTKNTSILAMMIVLLFILGMLSNYVAFEFRKTEIVIFLLWAFNNLFLVVLGEELFFRGFIQKELSTINQTYAWLIAAILFGVAHIGGGIEYMLLSCCAGLIYGWVYLKTNNIALPIFTHFAVNSIHFLFFTYPYLITAA